MNTYTEAEVRALRDGCFGVPISDREWDNCKATWMKPEEVQWLVEHQKPIGAK